MPMLHRSVVSLRFFGEDLDPTSLSKLLECAPTKAWSKGEVFSSGRLVRKKGAWFLEATDTEPADFDAQIAEIFAALPSDRALWAELTTRFHVDLFCGWFTAGDEGLSISPETTRAIGDRGLRLEICLYAPIDDDPRDPARTDGADPVHASRHRA